MMLWIRLALRNALRNLRRTLLTAGTVVAATALLMVALSYMEGIFAAVIADYTAAAGHIRIVDEGFAAREELFPLYENIEKMQPVLDALRAIDGVVDAQPRITTGVVITASEEIGDEVAIVTGATETYYKERLRGPESLAAGTWLTGKPKEVVLGRRLAARLEAGIGDEVLMLGQTQYGSMSPVTAKVVGIVGSNAMLDEQAFLPLAELQWLVDIPEGTVEVLVYAAGYEKPQVGPVLAALRGQPALQGLDVSGWYEREPWRSMFAMTGAIMGVVQLMIVFLASLAIFNTMTVSVLERTGEIGVMRAMGLTRLGAVGLFLVEALCIGLIGSVVGAALGSIGGWYLEVYGITLGEDVASKMGSSFPMRATFYGDVNLEVFITVIITGLFIAVIGAALPALRAASVQPVVAMHARR